MEDEYMAARHKLLADTLKCLHFGWKISKIGEANGAVIVCGGYPNTDWYYICDNGGEFNVGRVNHDSEMRSVPYTSNGYHNLLDGGTMAYRVSAVMREEEIDYAWSGDFLLEAA